jgi:hypothetical protein
MPGRETKQPNNEKAVHPNKERAVPHKVTPAERTAIEKHIARLAAKPRVRFKLSKKEGDPQISIDHPDKFIGEALLMDALASADVDFVNGIAKQLAKASKHSQDTDELNFMLSVVKGIEPRDQLEAMLAAQMAAVHVASMMLAFRLTHSENILEQDSTERAFNKLTRERAREGCGTTAGPHRY